jgi:molybdenum cofactor cytidylyltransferase
MTTAIAILAAGESRRLGQPKQLVQWRGDSLLQRAIDTACAVAPCVLLTLGKDGDALWRTLRATSGLERVDVPDSRDGLSASMRAVAAHAGSDPALERLLVMLVDQYAVDVTWLRSLLALADAHPLRMVASRYDGVRGVPAVFPRSAFAALKALQGDQGARTLLRSEPDPIDHIAPHAPGDVDTPEQVPLP